MKFVSLAALAVAGTIGAAQAAVTYNDSLNDIGIPGFNLQHIDIESVTMDNDASNLYVTLKMRGGGADWAKYTMLMDTGTGGTTSNGWSRPNIGSNMLADRWIGTWADGGGGGQVWSYSGSWSNNNFFNPNYGSFNANGSISWTLPLSWLGVSVGNTIYFDVMTTGGFDGDGGWDHLSNPNPSSNDYGALSVAGNPLAYTLVPTPGALAVLGLGVLGAGRRRR